MAKPQRPKQRSAFNPTSTGRSKPSLGNLQQQMLQLQEQMAQTQESLAEERVTATSGGGVVTVVATGNQQIESIKIDPQAVDPEDVEMLEDMIVAAVNEALGKAKALADERMSALTGNLQLPGLF